MKIANTKLYNSTQATSRTVTSPCSPPSVLASPNSHATSLELLSEPPSPPTQSGTADSKWFSIVAVNFWILGTTIQQIVYKTLASERKVTLSEYTLLRNMVILLMAIAGLLVKGIEPFDALPRDKRSAVLGRAFFGVTNSILINSSIELIPLSLLVIIY